MSLRQIMFVGGSLLSTINLLPLPWAIRRVWLRLLYDLTVQITLILPSALRFAEQQNTAYSMGKRSGEGYQSLVELEAVLRYIDSAGIPADQVRSAVEQAESECVPPEMWGGYIARTLLARETADRVMKEAVQVTRY